MLTDGNITEKIEDVATLGMSEIVQQLTIVNMVLLLSTEDGQLLITEEGNEIDLNRIW